MTTTRSDFTAETEPRRANPMGAYVTTLGALILLVSVWLNWTTFGTGDTEENAASGYESDSLIPFMGYLAIAFAIALLYATKRADRRQHRGLSLASMAVGLASVLWCLSFLIDPISTGQYNENVSTEIGPYIGLLGALVWAVGSFLLAKEPEGDVEATRTAQPVVRQAPVSTHTTTSNVSHDVDHTSDRGRTTSTTDKATTSGDVRHTSGTAKTSSHGSTTDSRDSAGGSTQQR